MFGISKKNLILFLFLLVLIIIIFYWQNIKEIVGPVTERIEKPSPTATMLPEDGKEPGTPEEDSEKSGLSKSEFIDYVGKNIASLSPEKPVLGGKWYVIRFWFVKDNIAYVEYEDGHISREILVEGKESGGEADCRVIGYFEPGANEWILKDGDDPYFGKLRELYEWDDISKAWKKR